MHDWPAAERWFGEATREGPSVPFAFTNWGLERLMRGDADGAIAVLRQAHKAGPHFADPLELTGEALMHKGDYQGAVAQFQMASQAAPRWGRVHLRWGQSLLRIGHQRDAKAQLNTARSSSLSVSDRAELDASPGDSLR